MRKSCVPMLLAVLALLAAALPADAQSTRFGTRLRSFDEVPSISAPGAGRFSAELSNDGTELTYRLEYFNLEAVVLQAHIHIAQPGVNGAIMVFLCSNLGNGPAGTPSCPLSPAVVTGTLTADDVAASQALMNQGIEAGELFSVIRAMRAGFAYANVHTAKFPGGEIRGQIRGLGRDGD